MLLASAPVGVRVGGAEIAAAAYTESELVWLSEIVKARPHPRDADSRLGESALVAEIIEIGSHPGKFTRYRLFGDFALAFGLGVEILRSFYACVLALRRFAGRIGWTLEGRAGSGDGDKENDKSPGADRDASN